MKDPVSDLKLVRVEMFLHCHSYDPDGSLPSFLIQVGVTLSGWTRDDMGVTGGDGGPAVGSARTLPGVHGHLARPVPIHTCLRDGTGRTRPPS